MTASAFAAEGWTEDFAKAKETAAAEKKDLLLDFTGSDWCGWCIKLEEEVFSKDAFKKAVPQHFVLVSLDFPHEKKQDEKTKEQNTKLQEDFNIQGFPSIILLDSAARPYAAIGYEEGGAANYVQHLEKLRQVREKRDAALTKAAKAEGLEKAKLITEALSELEEAWVHTFYKSEVDEVIAADATDTTGMKKARTKQVKAAVSRKKIAQAQAKLQEMSGDIEKLMEKKMTDEVAALIDKLIADEKLEGEAKQQITLSKLMVYGPDRLDDAAKLIDEVIAMDPESNSAEEAKALKERIADMKGEVERSRKDPDAAAEVVPPSAVKEK